MAGQCPSQIHALLSLAATVEQNMLPSGTHEASGCLHKVPRYLFAKTTGCSPRGAWMAQHTQTVGAAPGAPLSSSSCSITFCLLNQGSSGVLAPKAMGSACHLLPMVSTLLGTSNLCKQAIPAAKENPNMTRTREETRKAE